MKRSVRLVFLRLLALLAGLVVRSRPAAVTSVLYIKPDHLGDLLLATPALAALRQRLPGARVTALIGPWAEVVLRRNPDVDALLICPFPGFERGPATKDQGPTKIDRRSSLVIRLWSFVHRLFSVIKPYLVLLRYAALLRACRYDLAIVGRDDHWWGAALALLAGIPIRVGFDVAECRPFLARALAWDPRAHVTAQGLALVEAAADETRRAGEREPKDLDSHPLVSQSPDLRSFVSARFDPAPADLAWADDWMRAQGLAGARMVVVHPGTGGPAKLWRAERWARVADLLYERGARMVLTGGPGEEPLVAAVAEHMRASALTLAGRTSVGQLAALLRRAALALGVDSGPLHLAAAQGTPSVHLFGPGDAGRFGPWGDPRRHIVVHEELWCSPCGVFSACPRGLERPECMELIEVDRVVEIAASLLSLK